MGMGISPELLEMLPKLNAAGVYDEDSAVLALKSLGESGGAKALASLHSLVTPLVTRVAREVLHQELPHVMNTFITMLHNILLGNAPMPAAQEVVAKLEDYVKEP
ncbi:hypothetical protein HaLaN_18338 [Haematococcus lacustris]|uniref:Uncharacterized protein n=1 Tax=Haematococcus lacustris TaxID=44745 RepID=A0A699ZJ32_HAELA|nr:hypothetical protein HaLaN_18338 [Haematococcus lacustris]